MGNLAGNNLTNGHFNIDIGNEGIAGESNVIRIGREGTHTATHIAGIFNELVAPNNLPVLIDSTGKLGTAFGSSRRFKKEIKAMEKVSEAVLALKPVTFYYKDDKADTPQFGLIAEEVAKVNPELVLSDKEGKPYTVRYDAVNAMLLNEFLKEHRTVQEQGQELQKQAATIAKQQKQIEALTAGLQKVSAQLEVGKPAPQVVNNP
jgi:trimeric autotransporter adhesin